VGKASTNGRLEVVHGHALAREEMAILEHTRAIGNSSGALSGRRATLLFAKLACSAER
jgi:hypothetical protein